MEWWSNGVVEWWSGGVVEWWSDGVVEWWSGGVTRHASTKAANMARMQIGSGSLQGRFPDRAGGRYSLASRCCEPKPPNAHFFSAVLKLDF
jgi:hypothetical protein